jgi:rhamnulose-1-phosphate aldolase/alcohol dehydrogenase
LQPIENLWDGVHAATLDEPQLLLYRSNLLGRDLRITNFGGGNTSAKLPGKDPLTGAEEPVLWVKGSGGDLGSMKLDGFATLYQRKLEQLKSLYRGPAHEDEMVGYLPHCTFGLNPRAASIDTPLHAFIPRAHVDHVHPDAVIAIACTRRSREFTAEAFGGEIGWLAWQRPGFDLGLKLEQLVRANPHYAGVVLEGHGLFTWADSARECYETTLRIVRRAGEWLAAHGAASAFGEPLREGIRDGVERHRIAATLMPLIRGRISAAQHKVGHFCDAPEVLEFVNSTRLAPLAALGTSCPDHFLRTKIRPLVVDFDPTATDRAAELQRCAQGLDEALARYRDDYAAYYRRCAHPDSPPLRDANPVIHLIPGVGMLSFARDKATARIAAEFYVNAINVMREAERVDSYVALPEQEAFDIEYWLLEEAKLQRMPKPGSLAGRVALVTGGAGGIGTATARRLLEEGACVVLADIDQAALDATMRKLAQAHGVDAVRGVICDVTREDSVTHACERLAVDYGGLDILVSNAGIASSAALEDTSLELWNLNMGILATGYFLVTREAFRLMKRQACGGAIAFIASKNALVASVNASAYCTAKAAEVQLARAVALEGAPLGIRCNVVNPDAVLRGSKIWSGAWRRERAEAYNMDEDALEEHYRQRSLLKRNVFPEDIAEAVYFLVSDRSAKSTGNIINVDAGHAPSFTR